VFCAARQKLRPPPIWGSYVELEGVAGGTRERGQLNFFFPLLQDSGSILFADLRGQLDDQSGNQGNWGLAYRQLLDNGLIIGVNGYFDLGNSRFDNQFSQAGFGFELLSVDAGARLNAYLPENEVQSTGTFGGPATAVLINNNIFINSGQFEGAYRGLDFEYEKLLWWHGTRDRRPATSGLAPEVELWASAGAFHYGAATAGLEDFTGPRLRTELRMFDTPLLGNDSRVVLAGQYDYDDVRGSQGTAMVSVRIPLGKISRRRGRRLSWIARRMVAPIRRQTQIVTDTTGGGLEAALIARTGRQIASATVIDANTVNPGDVITNAGADSVVIVDGTAGVILPASMVTLSDGQTVIGGGTALALIGAQSGTAVTFTTPGSNPGVLIGTGGGFNLATDSTITALTLNIDGATAFNLNNVNNALISDSSIFADGDTLVGGPFFLLDAQNSQFAFTGSDFLTSNTNPAGAAYALLNAQNSQVVLQGSIFTLVNSNTAGPAAIVAQDSQIEFLSASLTTFNGANEFDGVILNGNSTFLSDVSNITVTSPNGDVIVASDTSRFTIIGSALESASSNVIVASDDTVFSISSSALTGGDNGIVASGNSRFLLLRSAPAAQSTQHLSTRDLLRSILLPEQGL